MARRTVQIVAWVIFALSVVCYAVSFFLKTVSSRELYLSGWEVFLGNIGVGAKYRTDLLFVVWFANPGLWVCTVLFAQKSYRAAAVVGGFVCICAYTAIWGFTPRYPALIGHSVWFWSLVLSSAASLIACFVWEPPDDELEEMIRRFRKKSKRYAKQSWSERVGNASNNVDETVQREKVSEGRSQP